MHPNSILAYKETKEERERRKQDILRVYELSTRPIIDREVCERLGFFDMNKVRPRITEMIQERKLRQVGKRKDHVTRKSVREVELIRAHTQLQLSMGA
jgi:hypothetical protein